MSRVSRSLAFSSGNPASEIRSTSDIPLSPEFRNRYDIGRVLGRGGCGMVVQGKRLADGCDVAIKFLIKTSNPDHLNRFLQEGRLLAEVRHASVVSLLELGELDQHPYIVQEYVDGGSLRGRLTGGRVLPVIEGLRIAIEVLEGLDACHGRGIVHRDMKPENILLSSCGPAKIADLGIAKAYGIDQSLTATGAVIGTPRYMSPEQLRGEVVSVGCDLFAVSSVLYEMLAGRPAFDGNDLPELMAAIAEREPPALESVRDDIPPALSRIVQQGLSKRVADRPQTAADMVVALRRLLWGVDPASRLAAAPALPLEQRAWRPRGKLVSSAIAAMLVITIGAVFRQTGRDPHATPDHEPAGLAPSTGCEALELESRDREAEECLLAEVRANSADTAARLRLAWFKLRSNRPNEAESEFRRVLRADLRSAQARSGVGRALLDQGRIEEAQEEFQTAASQEPALAGAHLGLSLLRQRQGRREEAITELKQALERTAVDRWEVRELCEHATRLEIRADSVCGKR